MEVEMSDLRVRPGAHWRDCAKEPRLFVVDYRLCFPLLALLFYPRMVTLYAAIVAILFFGAIERYGFSVVVFRRWLLGTMAGKYKSATPWWFRR